MPDDFLIGIDLGGTKIAAAVFGIDGKQRGTVVRLPTMARMQPAVTLTNMKRVVKQAKLSAGVAGVPQGRRHGQFWPARPEKPSPSRP